MYFWTNTPDQADFISNAAQVNKLNSFINDPNTDEEQAEEFSKQFVQAKEAMFKSFLKVIQEWEDWLEQNNFGIPVFSQNGKITVPSLNGKTSATVLEDSPYFQEDSPSVLHWADFYRILALQAFLNRVSAPPGTERHDPEEFFREHS